MFCTFLDFFSLSNWGRILIVAWKYEWLILNVFFRLWIDLVQVFWPSFSCMLSATCSTTFFLRTYTMGSLLIDCKFWIWCVDSWDSIWVTQGGSKVVWYELSWVLYWGSQIWYSFLPLNIFFGIKELLFKGNIHELMYFFGNRWITLVPFFYLGNIHGWYTWWILCQL